MTSQNVPPLHLPSTAGAAQAEIGALPEWNLSHLYPGMDSEGFRRDLAVVTTGTRLQRLVRRDAGCRR